MKSIKEDIPSNGKLHWYHWSVVIASLILTIGAWYITSKQAEQKTLVQFDYQAEQIIQLVRERMEKYEQALWSGVASIHSQTYGIAHKEWSRFSQTLSIEERYPGINGIGVIYYLTEESLPNYLREKRKERPDYGIHPQHSEKEFWPITYIEPEEINKKAVGLDMAHETNRFTAAKKSRDSGQAQITGPIILVQDAKRTPGFLFYAPFYLTIDVPANLKQKKEKFIGLVYAPFIMEKLMRGTLQNKNRLVNFRITDKVDLLYDELHQGSEDYDSNPLFTKTISINMYGRQWQFEVQSSYIFRQQQSNAQPLMILIGGIIIDSMLLGLFMVLARSNKKAIALANQMTYEFKESEHRLNITVDNMLDGLITLDSHNQILSVNKPALKMFQINESEIIDASSKVLKIQNTNDENITDFIDVTNSKFSKKRQIVNMLKMSGKVFPVEISVNQTMTESKNYFIVILRDMSLKLETEQALSVTQATLEAAVKASSTSFAIVDKSGIFIETNRALHRWLGYEENILKGQPLTSVIPKAEQAATNELLISLLEGTRETILLERQYQRKDGSLVWGLFSAATVRDKDGQSVYAVIQIVDIQNERELLNNLTFQNKALEKSNADLEQFAYIASHDLKSPLDAIYQLSSWIEEDCRDILPESSKKHLSLLMGRSARMTRLLEDLLNYSRVNHFEFESEKVNLQQTVKEQFELVNRSPEFCCESDDAILIVPRIPFEIIIRNLLSNAIKHHDKIEGLIQIQLNQNNDSYQLTITDDGPGIPPNMHNKVIEMFQTLKSRDDVEGSGMGLAMVKRIISHYKGELKILSDGKRGTSIIIEWPLGEKVLINHYLDETLAIEGK